MAETITLGEILVEIMRPDVGQPLDQPGEFHGPFPSGAPAIFAVAAARLGLEVGFIGTVGKDAFGRLMRSCFEKEKVDVSQLQSLTGHATGTAFVAYDLDGGREFVFHIRHAAAGQLSGEHILEKYFDNVKWLHISGSTLALNENSRTACQRAVEFTLAAGGKISLDPNLRSELMPLKAFKEILTPYLAEADLLLPTESEALALTGEIDADDAVKKLNLKSNAITVLKKGPMGCVIYHDHQKLKLPGFSVSEIDPTGAGDCFSAAFVAGLEAGWPLARVGRFANAAGALAVTQLGPLEGAPTYQQVQALTGRTVE